MDSVLSNSPEVFDSECLKQEDCQYILRALEKRAFEYIVCALRAQGPLSQYKEVILDHLKSLLFISDDDFLLRIRLSANDPILTKIAQELNPSYDNVSEWLAAGYSLVSLDFSKVVQMNSSIDKKNSVLAAAMQKEMAKHNACLDEERGALLKLLQLSKKPYVPEKLRRLLHDTEKDIHGRSDIVKEKTTGKTRHVGRPRRAESAGPTNINNNVSDSDVLKNKNVNNLTNKNDQNAKQNSIKLNLNNPVPRTSPITVSVLNAINNNNNNLSTPNDSACLLAKQNEPVLHGIAGTINTSPENGVHNSQQIIQQPVCQSKIKNEETENHKLHGEFSIHYSGGANVVIVDPEDQNTIKEPKIRKRRSKVIDDISCTCARVLPFIFERAIGDMPKPPRGNPDKRCSKLKAAAKRASQLGYSGNNDLINSSYNYVPKQIELSSNSYYSKNLGYINSNATSSVDHLPTPSKRTRGDDESEVGCIVQNVVYQKPQSHHNSRTIINSNSFSSPSVQRQQHTYYNNPIINSTANRHFNFLPNGNLGDAEILNSNVEFRNSPSQIMASKNIQPTIIMTTGSNSRIIPQDVQLVEDGITSEAFGNDVYLECQPIQLSSHQQNTPISTFKDESSIANSELYLEATDDTQYTVGNVVIQTVSNNEQSKNSFQNIVSSQIQAYEQPIAQTSTSPISGNYHFASSGLDFLASTASLLTPMNKQSGGVQTDFDNNHQTQNLNTKISNSVQPLTASTIIPSNDSYGLQTALQGNQHILTSHLYIVSSQKNDETLAALHLQNSSTPKILEASVPTKTYIVDYNSPPSLS